MARESAPKKLFRIGEVSQLTGVNPHILRYWESEFQILAPNRRLSKQRLYRQADIDLILTIKRLLEVEQYTLSGVKHYLTANFADRQETTIAAPAKAVLPAPASSQPSTILKIVRKELLEIRKILGERQKE
jgi:DNA-binding transcriptional MerR regulator